MYREYQGLSLLLIPLKVTEGDADLALYHMVEFLTIVESHF